METGHAIRTVIDAPGGGRIVTLGVPGLEIARDGAAWLSPESMEETIRHLAQLRTCLLLLLGEAAEYPPDTIGMVRRLCGLHDIRVVALPIADFSAPSPAWERAWRKIAAGIGRRLDAGETIGLCCFYGAGRSGMIAAMMLQERGLDTDEAIAAVRRGFSESIESPVQEAWLRERGRTLHGAGAPRGHV